MDIYSFEQILSQNLTWNRARIKFLARFMVALFSIKFRTKATISTTYATFVLYLVYFY